MKKSFRLPDSLVLLFANKNDPKSLDRRHILCGGYFSICASNFMVGVLLTGLILEILKGESETVRNSYLGTMVTMQTVASLFQLFSPMLFEHLPKVKVRALTFLCLHYFINAVVLGLIPFLPVSPVIKAVIFIGAVFLMQIFAALYGPPTTMMHINCIPTDIRAKYFSITTVTQPIFSSVSVLTASMLMDSMKASLGYFTAMIIIRLIGLAFAAMNIYLYAKVAEYPREISKTKVGLKPVLTVPIKFPRYFASCIVGFIWSFAANLPGSYFNAYLLENLKMPYSYISAASLIAIPALLIFTPLWSRLMKRVSWFGILSIALILYSFAYMGNAFVTRDWIWLYYVIATVGNTMAPGINLAFANVPYINLPKENQTSAYSFYAVFTGIGTTLGVFLGQQFIALTERFDLNVFGLVMQNRQYIMILAASLMAMLSLIVVFVSKSNKRHNAEY